MKKKNNFIVDEALANIQLSDTIQIPTQRTLTDSGQMIVPCRFARTGIQLYKASQLGLVDLAPDEIVEVHRGEQEVFDEASVSSFRSVPVTLGHPRQEDGSPVFVNSLNAKELQVGMLEGLPTRDEDTLCGTLVLTNQEAIDALDEGAQELSAGYTCDIVLVDGKYYQRNIRANHIAIVGAGRAGPNFKIADEDITITFLNDAMVEMLGKVGVEVTTKTPQDEAITQLADAFLETTGKLQVQTDLVLDFKAASEKSELELEKLKVELADAKVAAEQNVVERCYAIENARLIADMRDLGDKTVEQIKLMVVEDQYPSKDFSSKSEAYIDAMFEMLVDAAKGETPMSKLMAKQQSHVVVDSKQVDPVALARANMIKRQSNTK